MLYDCVINGAPTIAHIDPGASGCFIDPAEASRLNLAISPFTETVELGNGSLVTAHGLTKAKLSVDGVNCTQKLLVLMLHGDVKMIIGRNWLYRHNPGSSARLRVKRADGSVQIIQPRNTTSQPKHLTLKRISASVTSKLVRKRKAELFSFRVNPKMTDDRVSPDFKDIVEEYGDVFRDELPDTLPPHRKINFEVNLKQDSTPPVRPVIRLSPEELAELKRQLQILLSKGFIRPSSSPYGAPVFFVKKKEGDLRMVSDYRALNKITIPNSNPVPLISEALDHVNEAQIFSKIDLLSAYHQMRIRDVDIPKTAIRTRFGTF